MKDKKYYWNRLKRWLHITKPIELSKYDVKWIKLMKFHYEDKYPMKGGWIETMKPMFNEIYAWDADEHYNDYLDCIFQKLFDLYLKIQLDQSGNNVHLKSIITASFNQSILTGDYKKPIERVICKLCSEITCNTVIEKGVFRYNINE